MSLEALGDGEGQGGLQYCSPRGQKESDTTGRLNTATELTQQVTIPEGLGLPTRRLCSADHTPYTDSHPYSFTRRRRKAVKTGVS